MRLSRHLVLFLLLSLLSFVLCQQESNSEKEESNIPRRVLRKYRVRKPNIVDENGVTVAPAPKTRLRRIRVQKQPTSTTESNFRNNNLIREVTPEQLIDSKYGSPNQPQALSQQQQQVIYNEQEVVEPVRVVPTYRKATPSSTRTQLLANVNYRERDDDNTKNKPAVGTTRNYSNINEDGSFTFGYEGEDGSFKEETRGTDCVVRGKYGYVDPDGVRREFSYVSGNPCDPNDPSRDENEAEEEDEIKISRAPINRPRRPLVIQQEVQQSLEETPEPQRQRVRIQRPVEQFEPTTFRPRVRITQPPPTIPPQRFFNEPQQALGRSVSSAQSNFNFRPSFSLTTQPRPVINEPSQPLDDNRGSRGFNFDSALEQIQYQPQRQQPQPQPPTQQRFAQHSFPQRQYFGGANAASLFNSKKNEDAEVRNNERGNYANYRTELVYDPASGQYTSILVQDIPKTNEEFTLTQRLRAFADPEQNKFQLQNFGQPEVQYFPSQQQQRQPFYQQQAQSQNAQVLRNLNGLHYDAQEAFSSPASGQIDAFLRTLN